MSVLLPDNVRMVRRFQSGQSHWAKKFLSRFNARANAARVGFEPISRKAETNGSHKRLRVESPCRGQWPFHSSGASDVIVCHRPVSVLRNEIAIAHLRW